jgi:5-methylcytosine-specific restriction endonuclease McrA
MLYKRNGIWVRDTKKNLQIVSPSALKRKREAFERKKLTAAFKRWRIYNYRKQGGKCFYCLNKIVGAIITDHYVPLYRGGTSAYKNLRVVCWSCNKIKSVRLPSESLIQELRNYHETGLSRTRVL